MKKFILIIMCCLVIAISGCTTSSDKYKRISFESETLGDELLKYVNEDTVVINTLNENFPAKFSVYKISERKISDNEFEQMKKQLGIEGTNVDVRLEGSGNVVSVTIKPVSDPNYEDFTMTDEALEKLAWETFNKLPFMDGDYEYCGIKIRDTISDSTDTHLVRVGVSFRRIIDDIKILGSEQCYLYFENTGLVEMFIKLYNYEKISNMDMVTLEKASSMIKNPDSFTVDTENSGQKLGSIDTLQVDKTELLFYNQYYRGCTILQPVYSFVGTATDADGVKAEFDSRVIAIPDAYTYEGE